MRRCGWFAFVAAFLLHNAAHAEGCALDANAAPDTPSLHQGIVLGRASDDEVRTQTEIAIARTHAPISPAYINLPRVDAAYVAGGVRHVTIAAIVEGLVPSRGAVVLLSSRHRDPDAPCHFIPWTVIPGSGGVALDDEGGIAVRVRSSALGRQLE